LKQNSEHKYEGKESKENDIYQHPYKLSAPIDGLNINQNRNSLRSVFEGHEKQAEQPKPINENRVIVPQSEFND